MPALTHSPTRFASNVSTCIKCSRDAGCLGKCPEDGKPIHLHADAGYCPLDKLTVKGAKPEGWDTIDDATPTPEAKSPDAGEWGPKLWREFHAAPRAGFLAFLTDFFPRIPCGPCRDDTVQWVADHSPDLSSDDALDRWKNALHNAVNRKLGKPEMTVEDARQAQGL